MKQQLRIGIAALAISTLGLAGCSAQSSDPIVIGSQAYYSNEIVAEAYAQALEAAGYNVERSFSLGQRDVYVPAILEGEVDLFPEYTGNLLQYFNPEASETEAGAVYQALVAALPAGLSALAMSPATDQDSYNVTQEFAAANNLSSIADLANLGSVTLGGAPELAERPYGPQGLLSVYGVSVEFLATGDTTVESLLAGEIDMANVYSADPRINLLGLVTLSDPEGLFLASNLVPIASEALDQGARDAVNAVSSAMSADELVAMNVRSVEEQLSAAEIAADWLRSEGLID
ncbi:MAG: ABC transporter substrate-binding protein [Aquiluna sp.]|jgi:osmoprotectant transport system substrate-binding protein|nr:ABC transporter substrate-binding protein [Aquiluna sp.]